MSRSSSSGTERQLGECSFPPRTLSTPDSCFVSTTTTTTNTHVARHCISVGTRRLRICRDWPVSHKFSKTPSGQTALRKWLGRELEPPRPEHSTEASCSVKEISLYRAAGHRPKRYKYQYIHEGISVRNNKSDVRAVRRWARSRLRPWLAGWLFASLRIASQGHHRHVSSRCVGTPRFYMHMAHSGLAGPPRIWLAKKRPGRPGHVGLRAYPHQASVASHLRA